MLLPPGEVANLAYVVDECRLPPRMENLLRFELVKQVIPIYT